MLFFQNLFEILKILKQLFQRDERKVSGFRGSEVKCEKLKVKCEKLKVKKLKAWRSGSIDRSYPDEIRYSPFLRKI